MYKLFGDRMDNVINELNEALAGLRWVIMKIRRNYQRELGRQTKIARAIYDVIVRGYLLPTTVLMLGLLGHGRCPMPLRVQIIGTAFRHHQMQNVMSRRQAFNKAPRPLR